jgi:hypothetical protein
MTDKTEISKEDHIRAYKLLLQEYLAKRPSGLRRKIADAIGSNRSFASQITSPNYRVPIPSHNVHKIMEICHFTPIERTMFIAAYLLAHPGQTELVGNRDLSGTNHVEIDLSRVKDDDTRQLIMQTLRSQAEAMIAISISQAEEQSE